MKVDRKRIFVVSLALSFLSGEGFQFSRIASFSTSQVQLSSAKVLADKELQQRYRGIDDDNYNNFLNATNSNLRSTSRKKWGIDNINEKEYWFDNRIHSFGNRGLGGAVHAVLAPIATKVIDIKAYDGVDVRRQVARDLSKVVMKCKKKGRQQDIRVLDLCCGVGMSTRALQEALPNANTIVGLDTSKEMIRMARFLSTMKKVMREVFLLTSFQIFKAKRQSAPFRLAKSSLYAEGNAESTKFAENSFDLVTIMYAFHEAPKEGRGRILDEARRLLQPNGILAVVDISTEYQPSEYMLSGEPYVLEYQQNIDKQLSTAKGFTRATCKTVVPGHVNMWLLQKKQASYF